MKKPVKNILAIAGFVLSIVSLNTFAEAPSDASLKELLTVSESAKVVDNYFIQIDNMMKSGILQATAGQQLNAEQQKIMEEDAAHLYKGLQREPYARGSRRYCSLL